MDDIKVVGEGSTNLPNDKHVSGGSMPDQETLVDPKPPDHTSDNISTPIETMPDDSLFPTGKDSPMRDYLVQEVPLSPSGLAKGQNDNDNSPSLKVGDIDTAAPFESVKEAVSRFGRVVDWKAHRVQTTEKRVYIEQQHEKTNDEILPMKKNSEPEEEARLQKELDSTKRLIEELKLKLERAQTEEQEAKQYSELVKFRVEEMDEGIADDSSVAAKAQLDVVQARHTAAVAELASVKDELENQRKDYDLLVSEKDIAVERAWEAASSLKDVERQVENLTIQLKMTKESLESTHAARLEAEEHRKDALKWEQELEQAQEELEKTNQQIKSIENKKSKLDTATDLLQDLRTELAAYKESKLTRDNPENSMQAAKKNVEDVKQNITKATEEIGYLKTAVSSLKNELERQKAALAAVRQSEGMAEVVVASLEAELNRTISEVALVQSKEKEARKKMMDLPRQLQKAAQEADRAKSQAQEAREELKKAKELVEQAKDGASTMASRLLAAQKEIEAAKAIEKLALAAIDALHKPKNEPKTEVTLTMEEYYELSNKAHEAEEAAHTRVAEAVSLIDVGKETESKRLGKLEQVTLELAARKQAFDAALQKAEKAEQGKLGVEKDLRKWRAEHEQRRKAGLGVGPREGFEEVKSFSVRHINPSNHNSMPVLKTVLPERNSNSVGSSPEVRSLKKKKRSFFPVWI